MKHFDQAPAGLHLDAALKALATTFRGMTARPDEHNCECHWGSAEDWLVCHAPERLRAGRSCNPADPCAGGIYGG
ncbi:hypothetical protein ACGFNP_30835 [Nonomuraea sp. NPDC049269]|uniref:hypothetical protein n=1 Tax=Nonomuraea sp. NPDC049269 TaxID=3364349 RepID=UPI0037126CAA